MSAALGSRKERDQELKPATWRLDPTNSTNSETGQSGRPWGRGGGGVQKGSVLYKSQGPHAQGCAEGRTGIHREAGCRGPLSSTKSQHRLLPASSVEAAPREALRRTQAWKGRGRGRAGRGRGETCVRLSTYGPPGI